MKPLPKCTFATNIHVRLITGLTQQWVLCSLAQFHRQYTAAYFPLSLKCSLCTNIYSLSVKRQFSLAENPLS